MTNVAIEQKIGMLSAEFRNSLIDYLDFLLAKQSKKLNQQKMTSGFLKKILRIWKK